VSTAAPALPNRWAGAWIDALAFVGGLAMAWFADWKTADLVWSLWLSSLVVGYAMIVWNLTTSLREFGGNVLKDAHRGFAWMGGALLLVAGFLFGLAFFTVHFGGFHFVHSVFLSVFFPLVPGGTTSSDLLDLARYEEIFRRYWIFLPIAFLAERAAFVTQPVAEPDVSVKPKDIKRRKKAAAGALMIGPYKNVVRMHLLIFFFAFMHFVHLENFFVYAVVYAVYFFPWKRTLRVKDTRPITIANS
jgi:hypothetical protein